MNAPSGASVLCGNRTSVGYDTGTLGRCELAAGHPGPHQEQRADNGMPRQWKDAS